MTRSIALPPSKRAEQAATSRAPAGLLAVWLDRVGGARSGHKRFYLFEPATKTRIVEYTCLCKRFQYRLCT